MPTPPLQVIETTRLPTPLERTHALVLAHRDRRNLLGRWLTLLGVNSCRTTLDSTPVSSLTPTSAQELVVTEVAAPQLARQVALLRTRGWRNIIASTDIISGEFAAAALRRDVRVVLQRSKTPRKPNPSPTNQPRRATVQTIPDAQQPAETKIPELQARAQEAVSQLTGRERTILRLVARGWSNREIGDHLGLSHLTVKSHLSRISRKLGTGDRACMVLIGMRGRVVT